MNATRWCVAALLSIALVPCAADIAGMVVSVHDGDTITVLVDRRQVRVRLTEIDAPELGQPYGRRSRASLAQMCAGQAARIVDAGTDRYGRTLGRATCSGIDANAEQVRRGMAWVYDRYMTERSLYRLQGEAKAGRVGLWADRVPVPPWEWRKAKREHRVLRH